MMDHQQIVLVSADKGARRGEFPLGERPNASAARALTASRQSVGALF
jgi:hypothetical protein